MTPSIYIYFTFLSKSFRFIHFLDINHKFSSDSNPESEYDILRNRNFAGNFNLFNMYSYQSEYFWHVFEITRFFYVGPSAGGLNISSIRESLRESRALRDHSGPDPLPPKISFSIQIKHILLNLKHFCILNFSSTPEIYFMKMRIDTTECLCQIGIFSFRKMIKFKSIFFSFKNENFDFLWTFLIIQKPHVIYFTICIKRSTDKKRIYDSCYIDNYKVWILWWTSS